MDSRVCYPITKIPEYLIGTVTAPIGGLYPGEVLIVNTVDNSIKKNFSQYSMTIPTIENLNTESLAIVISGGNFETLKDGRNPKGQSDYTKYKYETGETTPILFLEPRVMFYISDDCFEHHIEEDTYIYGEPETITMTNSLEKPNGIKTIAKVLAKHKFRMGGMFGENEINGNICVVLPYGSGDLSTEPTYLRQSEPSSAIGLGIEPEKIEHVYFVDTIKPETKANIEVVDLSLMHDGTVKGWVIPSETEDMYDVYIGSYGPIYAPANCRGLFENLKNCLSIENLEKLRTDNVVDMSNMFANCRKLTTLDTSHFDTFNVENMASMFANCNSLTKIDVGGFDTRYVTTMSCMFANCENADQIDVSTFNTENVTNMYEMFNNCKSLEGLNVSGFNTSKVTNIMGMFEGCENVSRLDVSDFDTSLISEFDGMFYRCSSLETLDLSKWDFSQAISAVSLFAECENLVYIEMPTMEDVRFADVTAMFAGCKHLTNIDDIVQKIDMSYVFEAGVMLADCILLTNLDFWFLEPNFRHINNMEGIVAGCTNLRKLGFSANKLIDSSADGAFESIPQDCEIVVETELLKEWVLTIRDDLTNIIVLKSMHVFNDVIANRNLRYLSDDCKIGCAYISDFGNHQYTEVTNTYKLPIYILNSTTKKYDYLDIDMSELIGRSAIVGEILLNQEGTLAYIMNQNGPQMVVEIDKINRHGKIYWTPTNKGFLTDFERNQIIVDDYAYQNSSNILRYDRENHVLIEMTHEGSSWYNSYDVPRERGFGTIGKINSNTYRIWNKVNGGMYLLTFDATQNKATSVLERTLIPAMFGSYNTISSKGSFLYDGKGNLRIMQNGAMPILWNFGGNGLLMIDEENNSVIYMNGNRLETYDITNIESGMEPTLLYEDDNFGAAVPFSIQKQINSNIFRINETLYEYD